MTVRLEMVSAWAPSIEPRAWSSGPSSFLDSANPDFRSTRRTLDRDSCRCWSATTSRLRRWRKKIREARLLNLDRLYVAMTRARDRLYLIADEQPCDEIQRVRDYHFD